MWQIEQKFRQKTNINIEHASIYAFVALGSMLKAARFFLVHLTGRHWVWKTGERGGQGGIKKTVKIILLISCFVLSCGPLFRHVQATVQY